MNQDGFYLIYLKIDSCNYESVVDNLETHKGQSYSFGFKTANEIALSKG